jgi:hypothetical protein
MKKILFSIVLLSISSFSSAAVLAGYAEGSLIYGGLQTPQGTSRSFNSYNVGGTSFSLAMGYLFNTASLNIPRSVRIGIEGDYASLPDNKYGVNIGGDYRNFYTYSGRALSILGLVRYQFPTRWVVFGKAGLAQVVQTYSNNFTTLPTTAYQPEIVAGGGYQFTQHIATNLAYTYINGTQPNIGTYKNVAPVQFIGLSVDYLF